MSFERWMADYVRPMASRIRNMVRRSVVTRVNDDRKMQEIQANVFAVNDEQTEPDEIERFQPYGLTSVPLGPDADGNGAEAVILSCTGDSSHGIAVVVDDRRHRPTGLVAGEVRLYDDQGQYVGLFRANIIIEAPEILLGDGATKGVNRQGDNVFANTAPDVWGVWLAAVGTATGAGPPPTSAFGTTGAGSSIVKAVD